MLAFLGKEILKKCYLKRMVNDTNMGMSSRAQVLRLFLSVYVYVEDVEKGWKETEHRRSDAMNRSGVFRLHAKRSKG